MMKFTCIVCNSPMKIGLTEWHHVCPECGYESALLEPQINEAVLHQNVDEEGRMSGLVTLRKNNFRELLKIIKPLVSLNAKKLLDVGSAHGWFLDMAKNDYQVLGIEPDVNMHRESVSRGLPVRLGYFPNVLNSEDYFDVIVFNDVIEHIPQISSAITACNDRLNQGGILVLNLPNSKGYYYQIAKFLSKFGLINSFERLWQKGLPSPHLHYFNPTNLEKFVEHHGFVQVFTGELATVQLNGLYHRLNHVNNPNMLKIYLAYLFVFLSFPIMTLFPSDIIFSVFRKNDVITK